MSFEDLVSIIKAALSGKDALGAINDNPRLLLIPFALALLGILPPLIKHKLYGWGIAAFVAAAAMGTIFYYQTGASGSATVSPSGFPSGQLSQSQPFSRPPTPTDRPLGPTQGRLAFELYEGQVLYLGDLAGIDRYRQKMSLDECQIRCGTDARCTAFTFDKVEKICYLKAAVTTMHTLATAVSGIKRGPMLSKAP